MKLLSAFGKQVEQVGTVQRVWLTSFVINIEFIETYVLPVILGMDPPKLRMDYEGMQQVLSERGIDVRVFCDKRFVEPDQNKRTAIPIHGVSPERLSPNAEINFSERSLFHPKVIYLQGEKGSVLGSGSANLTVDGWGRNQEVFSFVPVASRNMAESVRSFFEPVFANVQERFPDDFPAPEQNANLGIDFCHSLAGAPFLTQLLEGKATELAVWSPYFSRDISHYVRSLQRYADAPGLRVQLVPDRVDNQYLRAEWSQGLSELHGHGLLSLHKSPVKRDDRSFMTHAKLWKSPERLAIGSWNFTQPGSNLITGSSAQSQNVEAGFIARSDASLADFVGEALPLTESLFATPDQIEQESLRVPEPPPFDLRVVFDWQTERFHISGVWLGKTEPDDNFRLELPGFSHSIELSWMPDPENDDFILEELELPVTTTKPLLVNRSYEVLSGLGFVIKGLIIETRPIFRRAQQYEHLRDLLDALVLTGGEPPADDATYRVQEDVDGKVLVDALESDAVGAISEHEHQSTNISYFRLFSACHHYEELLLNCRDQKELEYWAFIRPGCLQELVEKTEHRIESSSVPSLFNWFLAQEVNQLCLTARAQYSQLPGNGVDTTAERWGALLVDEPALPSSLSDEYLAWLVDEYHRRSSHREKI